MPEQRRPLKVLVTAPYFLPVMVRYKPALAARGIELIPARVTERLEEDELLPLLKGVSGVISGDDRFTARVLESAKDLKVISKWGTGIDSIDLDAAQRLGIAVRNTPGAFNEPVADQVMGYILAFARRIPWITQALRAGQWSKQPCQSLSGKTLGVIGVGNTGKAVVQRALGFGMRLLGNDIVDMATEFLTSTGIQMTDKSTLLKESDYVSLNCTLNPTSHHIVAAPELAQMKPTAVLINCARGPLIDEPALVGALQKGKIAGAALDVFEVEPLQLDSPLRKMDNVLLSPHNANSSPEHWERVHEATLANLLEVLSDGNISD